MRIMKKIMNKKKKKKKKGSRKKGVGESLPYRKTFDSRQDKLAWSIICESLF